MGSRPELTALEAALFAFYRAHLCHWAPLEGSLDPATIFALWDRLVGWRWVDDGFLLDAVYVLDAPRLKQAAEHSASLRALAKL